MSIDFEIGSRRYSARPLSVFDQMIVGKRVMPLMKGILTPEVMGSVIAAKRAAPDAKLDVLAMDLGKFLPGMADAIYGLADEDLRKVVEICLKGVSVQLPGSAFAPIMSPAGDIMFDWLGLSETVQIVWKMIEAHMGDFFSTAR